MATFPRPNRRRDRSAFLWAVAFFSLAQLVGYYCLVILPSTERFTETGQGVTAAPKLLESILHWQGHYLLTTKEPQDIVFLGDSSCLMGVMPNVIEKLTSLKVRNLGTLGILSSEGHADMLQLFIDRHGPPKLFVYYICLSTLAQVNRENTATTGYYQRFHDHLFRKPMTPLLDNPRTWFPTYHVSGRLFSASQQADIPKAFFLTPRGPYPSDAEVQQSFEDNKGFMSDPTGPLIRQAKVVPLQMTMLPDFQPGLLRMFETVQRHKCKMLIMMNPIPDEQDAPETATAFQLLETQFCELARPYSHVSIAYPMLRYYRTEVFATINHLNKDAALRNSEEIGLALRYKHLPTLLPSMVFNH